MGTLRKLKMKMKLDKELRHAIIPGTKNEILVDLDGDERPDMAFIDQSENGNIDTIALDLRGDGEFDFYLCDNDNNHIPDAIFFDEKGDGKLKTLVVGKDVEEGINLAAAAVFKAIEFDEYVTKALDDSLDDLQMKIRIFRRNLKK